MALIDLPCLKNERQISPIVSTPSIPTSASKNHGSHCGPSVLGSRLNADHPKKGVLIACRFTPEDLMREHGVLDRVLLIYDAAIRRLSANEDFDPTVISDSAKLVQDFIGDYHEK